EQPRRIWDEWIESECSQLKRRGRFGDYISRKERSPGWRHADANRYGCARGRSKARSCRCTKVATEFQQTVKRIRINRERGLLGKVTPSGPVFFVPGCSSGEPRRFAILARWPQSRKEYFLSMRWRIFTGRFLRRCRCDCRAPTGSPRTFPSFWEISSAG